MILHLMLLVTNSLWMAVLFGFVWGVARGSERITLSVIWPNFFGRKYIASLNSVGVTVMVILVARTASLWLRL